MGRNKFSQHEIDVIGKLLRRKCAGTRFQQKQIRHILRTEFEFNISDFGTQGKAYGPDELQESIRRGVIQILDDATIAAMKAKRERDRQHDAALRAVEEAATADTPDAASDWQAALRAWEEWEKSQQTQ